MKRSKFSDSQIIDAVKRVEAGIGVPDICRESTFMLLNFGIINNLFDLPNLRDQNKTWPGDSNLIASAIIKKIIKKIR
jgi:hypothetical protein